LYSNAMRAFCATTNSVRTESSEEFGISLFYSNPPVATPGKSHG
jgi:hypothetical protein